MNNLFEKFNILRFRSYEIIFNNNRLISNIDNKSIIVKEDDINIIDNTKNDLPIHIIYVGSINNKTNVNIKINNNNQFVFLTAKIINNSNSEFNINIINNGINSKFKGKLIIKNKSELNIKENCQQIKDYTELILYTRIINLKNSNSKISATATIDKNLKECISDINFSAIADINSKIEFLPIQYIKSIPISADHSASLYKEKPNQIQYLKSSGLNEKQTNKILKESFIKDIPLF